MTAQLDQSDLLSRASRLVEAAKRVGADAADAVSMRGVSLGVDVRLGKVEETNRAEGDDFTLRVFVGHRSAAVSASVITDPLALAERAVAMAKAAPEDPHSGLADRDRLARRFAALDLLDETIPDPTSLTDAARAAEDAMRAVAGVTNSGGASAGWSLGGMVLATSDGFQGSHLGSRFSVSASAIAGTGTAMERDSEAYSRTHRADLPDPALIGRTAGERAVRRLDPRKPPTGQATIVYDRRVASGLLGHLAGATNGAAIARGTSFLKDALGSQIMPADITITDDPARRRGLGSMPFDGEGVAAEAFDLISGGVLKTWFLDSASARELRLSTNGRAGRGGSGTSPRATNLTLLPGRLSREALLREVGDGIYVNEFIGMGVNGITGDYSRGAAGFLIRNGELAEPVSEMTIAGNLKEMYRRIVAADDLEYRYSVNAPTIAVEGLTVAGR